MDLADISNFFADILTFFHDGGKIEKSHGGTPPGPRGGAEAEKRSVVAPQLGPGGATPCFFSISHPS